MLDILIKNKQLTALALIAGAFYAYTKIMENQKLKLEIELLQRELQATGTVGSYGQQYRLYDPQYTGAQVV